MVIDSINNPSDLKKLNLEDKKELSKEIRELIINTVSKTGGHLASNLGVVELTIAIHSIFNAPKDKIIWDVGHQTYVHKILTGRKDKLDTLRTKNGIAGFPKTSESEYDTFNTGHSSNSISIALGMARSRDILKEDNKVIAIIGDGALTGGMALEALNDAGSSNSNLIVILNDNEMSISKNVGGISMLLTKLRTKQLYTKTNISGKRIIQKIPIIGRFLVKIIQKFKRSIKQLVIPKMYFEDIGFRYLGPVDGHNIEKLEEILKISTELDGPILIHVLTKKGKGYKPAEEKPDSFHSTSSFNISTGEKLSKGKIDYSRVMGDKLVKLAKQNEKIVAITAAMTDGTGLKEFSEKFPNRFFDVGIAEQHAVGLAAGFAAQGLIPVVPIYSSFLQRAYDQIIHDICLQNLPVIICIDRAGIVGNDGETHQGMFDMAFLNQIPNMNILAPKDFRELEDMLEFAVNLRKPVAIRYPRGSESAYKFEINRKIEYGKSEILCDGNDLTIVAIGKMVSKAMQVQEMLLKDKIKVEVINARTLKPLDSKTIQESINKTKTVVTIEDGILKGGLGEQIKLIANGAKIVNLGYPDRFIKQGNVDEIEKDYGLDIESIYKICKELCDENVSNRGKICKMPIKKNMIY